MIKKFTIPCDFGGVSAPFDVYVGNPKQGNHPLLNQANWLSRERGGTIPSDIMESFQKLLDLATKNDVSFEDLCVYALETAHKNKDGKGAAPVAKPSAAKVDAADIPSSPAETPYVPPAETDEGDSGGETMPAPSQSGAGAATGSKPPAGVSSPPAAAKPPTPPPAPQPSSPAATTPPPAAAPQQPAPAATTPPPATQTPPAAATPPQPATNPPAPAAPKPEDKKDDTSGSSATGEDTKKGSLF